jgi:hypothetical protein
MHSAGPIDAVRGLALHAIIYRVEFREFAIGHNGAVEKPCIPTEFDFRIVTLRLKESDPTSVTPLFERITSQLLIC